MSRDYDFENDIDAILAEFSSYSDELTGGKTEKDTPAAETEYRQDAPRTQRHNTPAPSAEPERRRPSSVKPGDESAARRRAVAESVRTLPRAEKTADSPRTEAGRQTAGRRPVNESPEYREDRTADRRRSSTRTAPGTEKGYRTGERAGKEREKPVYAPKEEKKEKKKRPLQAVISLIFVLLSAVVLAWVCANVHPESDTTAASTGAKLRLMDRQDRYLENMKGSVFSGIKAPPLPKYSIDENAASAPAPDPSGFRSVSLGEAAKVMDVIQKARDSGLLEEQDVIFSPDIDFYYDSDIKYYCDDTILVICWKELIDGNTCSCVEVKVADASQFRRKIADDTFGSPNQYYASTLYNQSNAVVGMNADFYMFRDFGVVVYQRELYRFGEAGFEKGYSNYNCIDNCFVTADGEFKFMHMGDTMTRDEMLQYIEDNDILFSIAFGPILIEDGEVKDCTWYPAGQPTTGYSRAGIGIYDKLHYFYMGLNHSPEKAARWTVTQFAGHMHDKGIDTAYGLDGGQTGEIVFQGVPYNYIDFGSERLVSDIIYFGTAIPTGEVAR